MSNKVDWAALNDLLGNVPHRRRNLLTGEWLLVSPQRTQRPWQGAIEESPDANRPSYDPDCYLCPGNRRANGVVNPPYTGTFVFTNDFPALVPEINAVKSTNKFFKAHAERGICRVVNYSPRHDLTMAEMTVAAIRKVIDIWVTEFRDLSAQPFIRYVQVFENKGQMMGNSNPHPHCQIWAQEHLPVEPAKEQRQFRTYYRKYRRSLLADYLKVELQNQVRIVLENPNFVVLVPFWAVWPFETLVAPKTPRSNLLELTAAEKDDFAEAVSILTIMYDNLFQTSFPYSAGIHQAPTDGKPHPEWHLHMHFYPPLLRSATIRKFMVGYEMLAEPQRDLTPEHGARLLRQQPRQHFRQKPFPKAS